MEEFNDCHTIVIADQCCVKNFWGEYVIRFINRGDNTPNYGTCIFTKKEKSHLQFTYEYAYLFVSRQRTTHWLFIYVNISIDEDGNFILELDKDGFQSVDEHKRYYVYHKEFKFSPVGILLSSIFKCKYPDEVPYNVLEYFKSIAKLEEFECNVFVKKTRTGVKQTRLAYSENFEDDTRKFVGNLPTSGDPRLLNVECLPDDDFIYITKPRLEEVKELISGYKSLTQEEFMIILNDEKSYYAGYDRDFENYCTFYGVGVINGGTPSVTKVKIRPLSSHAIFFLQGNNKN